MTIKLSNWAINSTSKRNMKVSCVTKINSILNLWTNHNHRRMISTIENIMMLISMHNSVLGIVTLMMTRMIIVNQTKISNKVKVIHHF